MADGTVTLIDRILPQVAAGKVPLWRIVLRGSSQLCFQTNELTGIIFLLATLVFSPVYTIYLLVGIIIGPVVGILLRSDRTLLEMGLFGFNPALTALALAYFFQPGLGVWIALPILCAVAAALTALAVRMFAFPTFAAPFLITFWIWWWLSAFLPVSKAALESPDDITHVFFQATFQGLGQAVFCVSIFAGMLYLLGVLLSNWRHGLIALMGSIVGLTVAHFGQADSTLINTGFFGFNGVLTAVSVWVFCGASIRLSLLGAILATVGLIALLNMPVPAMSLPFVLVSWLMIFLGWFEKKYNAPSAPAVESAIKANN